MAETQLLDESSLTKTDWKKHWQLLCRRRWFVALPAFAIFVLVWVLAWSLPAVYRSETVILVEQQKVPEQYVVSNVAADLQDRLQSMTQQILSRTRLLGIIEEFNLYPKIRERATPDDLVERMRKDIQVELVQAPNRSGNLTAFKIAYLSNNAALAQKVTSELTSLFIGDSEKVRLDYSKRTTDFLATQLTDAGRGLAEQEAKVKEFKSHYLGQLPEQVQSNVQILSGLQSRLEQETDLLGKAKQQGVYLATLKSQWGSVLANMNTGSNSGGVTTSQLDQELVHLRAQLATLRSHYTERHPDVRKLKDQIAKTERMQQQMATEKAGSEVATNGPDDVPHPASSQDMQAWSSQMEVESQIKANTVEIQNRERAIQELQKQIEEYQGRLNMTPVREQQLAGLTRDYEQSQKNYEQLLAKKAQSEMATDLEKQQEGEQFRVLDPPNLPQKPYSPNRLKFNLLGLVIGLFVGGMALASAEIIDDRVYSKEELADIVHAPVLTEIPSLTTTSEQVREQHFGWLKTAGLGGMVALILACFVTTYLFG
jgi:polysaccharide chain length determinant protein (PEP-CTERM system associated)